MKYVFDAKRGTMVPQKQPAIVESETIEEAPKSSESKSIVDKPQLENTDNSNEDEVVFKKFSDLTIIRVDDLPTGQWLCYFSGYALDIQFNLAELKTGNSTKKIEACLDGMKKLFRKIIFDQVLGD